MSTQSLPDPKDQAEDVKDDPTLARVLLSQVLIEESQALDQPPVPEFELLKNDSSYDKGTIKKIYNLMYDAQRRQIAELRGGTGADIPSDADRAAAKTLRSALCLSGRCIRSATFNLGILQGLARHGLLERFDYLSTVSGGGFIGGWLSAWIARAGLQKVTCELTETPKSPLKVEPDPIEHLRIYSNYLSPQPGLLSADTWTLVASVLRNLLLNWVIFLPVLFALLLVPRLWTSVLFRSTDETHPTPYWKYSIPISLAVAIISGVWAVIYIGSNLPSANSYKKNAEVPRFKGGQGSFIWHCLIWLVLSAAALSVFLWASRKTGNIFSWTSFTFEKGSLLQIYFFGYAELLILPGLIVCISKV